VIPDRRRLVSVALVVLVLAGCAAPTSTPRGNPAGDPIGWEDGYWYDDPIPVMTEDGLNESERRAAVARAMARVERIRGLEFERRVPVEVVSREEFREEYGGDVTSTVETDEHETWNNQVWEALFLVGENRTVSEAFDALYGDTVQGFYSSSDGGRIVLVSDSPTPQIDHATLAHELVHALQDQRLSLDVDADTQDGQLAADGLAEGDANHVRDLYVQRCDGSWDCLPQTLGNGGGAAGENFPFGVFLAVFQPYATGPSFVEDLKERSDGDDEWSAVNDAYSQFPESTEQVLHPEKYPDEQPVEVTVPDRSNGEWERFDVEPAADTVGEASIFAMFWDNEMAGVDPLSYRHVASMGWGGDSVVPYRAAGEGSGDQRYGYVWRSTWDTTQDAEDFESVYRNMLQKHNATRVGEDTYALEETAFADAFRVTRDGKTVTIVNAPTRPELREVHRPE